MPIYRQLHTKIIDSFDFSEMPDDFTRVVWILLMVMVDSEGRGIYNMAWIKSKMFPLRQDVSLEQLQDAFEWLSNRNMIKIYSVNNRDYFYIVTFKNYQTGTQKEAKSKLPDPIDNNSGVTLEEVGSNSGVSEEKVHVAVLHCIESESDLGSESGKNPFLSHLDAMIGCNFGGISDYETAEEMVNEFGEDRFRRAASWAKEKSLSPMRTALRSMNTSLRNGGFHNEKSNGNGNKQHTGPTGTKNEDGSFNL
jgi:hypothetical protein